MTLKRAIEILTYHNRWRRGEVDEYKDTPKEIGEAIDIVLESAHAIERLIPDIF